MDGILPAEAERLVAVGADERALVGLVGFDVSLVMMTRGQPGLAPRTLPNTTTEVAAALLLALRVG